MIWRRTALDLLVSSVVVILIGACAWADMAVKNRGAEQLVIDGGSKGVVPFSHYLHQTILKDCNVCHTLFPQEQGGINRLKAEGKLVKQQVMKLHCIKCHKRLKREGSPSGPTTCIKCHVKDKK